MCAPTRTKAFAFVSLLVVVIAGCGFRESGSGKVGCGPDGEVDVALAETSIVHFGLEALLFVLAIGGELVQSIAVDVVDELALGTDGELRVRGCRGHIGCLV